MKTKTITLTSIQMETIIAFLEWFKKEYDPHDRDCQFVMNRLTEKYEMSKQPDHNPSCLDIHDTEIWFLRNYLQSAWQDDSCTVESKALHELYDFIVENDK